ncbi:tRNA (adenosine(37)-N6)-threonylcarbamoyltransferase complex ATPase subunit type 1 TsaE [Candidatus Omnitrophota bacterium]
MRITTHSPQETIALGKKMARKLRKNDVIALYGELGSGKTTFTKGIAQGLGITRQTVNSPSFVLLKEYKGRLPLYHFDFYRTINPQEIFNIGFQEIVSAEGVTVIEWSERIEPYLPQDHLKITFVYKGSNRSITFKPKGTQYKRFLRVV